jgi:ABC-type multidrug transport system fused ATPase/permease subunit
VFTYPASDASVLHDVSLEVPHGSVCAVVGANGSGKSTLLSLLPRLYEPDSGRVLIDGVDIADCTIRSVRAQIAMVTQDTVLFDGTIGQNIAYGAWGASQEQIIEAARQARAHDFITALPDGYNAEIGERGQRLSGGQRQRLAIARAILRDPAILILDEATSQIDTDSEAQINAALARFVQDRTTFVIAHRLSTVVNADQIVVMADGAIASVGKHHELLEKSDIYRVLCRTQLHAAE